MNVKTISLTMMKIASNSNTLGPGIRAGAFFDGGKRMSYTRKPNETDDELIYRICSEKDVIGTWNTVADILNELLNIHMDESTYRKKYAKLKHPVKTSQEIESINEIEKEKIKLRDERNELRRLIREQARRESYKEQIIRSLANYPGIDLKREQYAPQFEISSSDNDMIISLFDIHAGIEIHNHVNNYNSDILEYRFNKYLNKIIKVRNTHNSQDAYVILSELLSGIIHPTLRIENNQDLIDQFLSVTDYISQFLAHLSSYFSNIHVYMAPGNHSRISPNKDESLTHENMDNLALPFLEAKMQNFKNIYFHENTIEQSIAAFEARGNYVVASHGDKESPLNAIQRLTLFLGRQPDLYYCGHKHTNSLTTISNSKVIQSGCISGSDSLCMDKRLSNKPEQTISIITNDGLDCLYDVTLE